jgi:hypothetical protein
VKKQAMPILSAKGEGAFVGLRMAIMPAPESARRAFAYLEGNETLVADGKVYEGTGTEDFFNSAWYFPDKPFVRAYGGMTEKNALPPRVAMFRLMIGDAVPFKRDFRFDFEVGKGNNADDLEWRWLAFWYQKEGGSFQIKDALGGNGAPGEAVRGDGLNENANAVRSIPALPLWAELILGVVLLAVVVLGLGAIVRRKKV